MNPNQILSAAFALLQRGDPNAAERELAQLWNAGPPPPHPAVHLLGLIRRAQGRIADAEVLLRQSIDADPGNAEYRNNLGRLLLGAGFPDYAVVAFEEALARNPKLDTARLNLARALDAVGRAEDAEREARTLLEANPTAEAFTVLGGALRQQARHAEALGAFERALALDPKSHGARHDRAIALDKLGLTADALAEFESLHAEGLRAPEFYRNWAGALMDNGRADEAERRLVEAVALHPGDPALHSGLARLRWVRGDTVAFTRDLEAAVRAQPDNIALRLTCADLLRRADRPIEAEAQLRQGLLRAPGEAALSGSLGVLRSEQNDFSGAETLFKRALERRPDDWNLRESLTTTLLQAGRSAEAQPHIEAALARQPHHSAWLAHKAVCLRMLGDPAYARLYDFERMVKPYEPAPPDGWPSIDAFNADLAVTLRAMHRLDAHPIDQSLRNGTQTSKSLLEVDDPVIRAFLAMIDSALIRHISEMPDDPDHPVWSRKPKSGRAKVVGCWSVRLKPGGYHVNHVHPEGWISSAYYVAVPDEVAGANDHRGWIQFGEPRWPTPGVTAERFIEPRPGRLALFPSCMWHGTVPFHEGEERLTVAFDAVPD